MLKIVERKKDLQKKFIFSNCIECNLKFKVYRPKHKYCSGLCKFRAWAKKNPRVKLT